MNKCGPVVLIAIFVIIIASNAKAKAQDQGSDFCDDFGGMIYKMAQARDAGTSEQTVLARVHRYATDHHWDIQQEINAKSWIANAYAWRGMKADTVQADAIQDCYFKLELKPLRDATNKARRAEAEADISAFKTALDRYYLDNGSYPTSDQGLAALVAAPTTGRIPADYPEGGYIEKVPNDPWGNPYYYQSDGKTFTLKASGVQ